MVKASAANHRVCDPAKSLVKNIGLAQQTGNGMARENVGSQSLGSGLGGDGPRAVLAKFGALAFAIGIGPGATGAIEAVFWRLSLPSVCRLCPTPIPAEREPHRFRRWTRCRRRPPCVWLCARRRSPAAAASREHQTPDARRGPPPGPGRRLRVRANASY